MINRTTSQAQTGSLFETHELIKFLNQVNLIVILALAINWAALESFMARFFDSDNGRPSLPLRRLIGLTMLKFIFNISDEQVVEQWKQNPYY
ncbi:MAG: transposase, partial [Deltaproteobacteria bacterium]|nr:transposase [Deltaproteobacteria bacterium]